MITKTKIDWCDFTWNPVWGCENKCPYCYARKFAKRLAENMALKEANFIWGNGFNNYTHHTNLWKLLVKEFQAFKPTWLESTYQRSFPKKPARIFVNSMSDPMYWKQEWYEKIVKRIADNMQHTFCILTKHPEVYERWDFPHNTWLGITCTEDYDFEHLIHIDFFNYYNNPNKIFVSIEPIKDKINSDYLCEVWDWIIVGPETGNRKDRVICKPEWLEPFFDLDIPVFMKDACAKIMDRPLRQEWPER